MPAAWSSAGDAGCQKKLDLGDQLEPEAGMQSKIGDGSRERIDRPLATAVFDFRFMTSYEPQLVPESQFFTRTHPVRGSHRHNHVLIGTSWSAYRARNQKSATVVR